jgi:hypothetical protein
LTCRFSTNSPPAPLPLTSSSDAVTEPCGTQHCHTRSAIRNSAQALLFQEAGVDLLTQHGVFLHRNNFTKRFITISYGTPLFAEIDWPSVIQSLDSADFTCSGGEGRMLRLAASLSGGIPVDLSDAVTWIDDMNLDCLIAALNHASGRSPPHAVIKT